MKKIFYLVICVTSMATAQTTVSFTGIEFKNKRVLQEMLRVDGIETSRTTKSLDILCKQDANGSIIELISGDVVVRKKITRNFFGIEALFYEGLFSCLAEKNTHYFFPEKFLIEKNNETILGSQGFNVLYKNSSTGEILKNDILEQGAAAYVATDITNYYFSSGNKYYNIIRDVFLLMESKKYISKVTLIQKRSENDLIGLFSELLDREVSYSETKKLLEYFLVIKENTTAEKIFENIRILKMK
jgi:hypothetical protein